MTDNRYGTLFVLAGIHAILFGISAAATANMIYDEILSSL